VIYKALPKYCHFCHVFGHTHLLCPKATATATTSLAPAVPEAQGNVFSRLGPCPPPKSPPPLPQLPDQSKHQDIPASQGVVGSPRLGPQPPSQPSPPLQQLQDQDIPASTQAVGSVVDLVPSTDWVTMVSQRKSNKQDKGKAIAVSEPLSVCTGPIRTSFGTNPLMANPCAEDARDPPLSYPESLVLTSSAGEGHNPSPPNSLEITTGDVNMAGNPVMEVSAPSRVRNRNKKQSGRSQRLSPFRKLVDGTT